jgi:hypothetical protein
MFVRQLMTASISAIAVLLANSALAEQANYKPPRLADGKPSLEGAWTNATLTPLQRPRKFKTLVIPDSEVEALTNSNPQVVRQRTDDAQDKNSKLDGSDLQGGRGYNAFWIDPGMTYNNVKGEYRTSWIIYPENGLIPFKDGTQRGRGEGGAVPRGGNFDGPEARPLGERCVINSGSAGPPMLPYLYNNNYEIIQTPEYVAIRVEMNNYTRIIHIGGKHLPANIRPIHGNSIGHWDGDTLVVETTNFSPLHATGIIPLSDTGKVTERFTRYSKNQILYEFTVEDPQRYKEPWRAEMSLNTADGRVFEYACHEGNYALSGTLQGAREEEKRAAEKASKK